MLTIIINIEPVMLLNISADFYSGFIYKKHLFENEILIYCNIINDFHVNFDQFRAFTLNIQTNKIIKKNYWPNLLNGSVKTLYEYVLCEYKVHINMYFFHNILCKLVLYFVCLKSRAVNRVKYVKDI